MAIDTRSDGIYPTFYVKFDKLWNIYGLNIYILIIYPRISPHQYDSHRDSSPK